MFPFITKTWNPLGGRCPYQCIYCWSMGEKGLVSRYDMAKYRGPPRLIEKEFKRQFKDGEFVFVQDMSDLFAKTVPNGMIQEVLNRIKEFPKTKFLLLTKNPIRYHAFHIPKNCVCGATIETDFPPESYGKQISKAPSVRDRTYWMIQLRHTKMVAIEPILDFSPDSFFTDITLIAPAFVAIGFDNYNNGLPEPESLEKVQEFINRLENAGIKVYKKTIREPVETIVA